MDHLLPSDEDADALLDCLARVIAARGGEPLVTGLIIEPSSRYFPDRWVPTARAAELLARRLLGYAGLSHLEALVDMEARFDEREAGDCALLQQDLPVWFLGLTDGCCLFGVDEGLLEDAELTAASLCHAVAHAYRVHHGVAIPSTSTGTYRERPTRLAAAEAMEERLTDVTAICLGFGVLAANASHRQRTTGRMQGSIATWQMTTSRLGTLDAYSVSYLLAAQVVARGMDARARRGLLAHLETNQAAFFEAACTALEKPGPEALRARLGVPAPTTWPEPPNLDELARPYPEALEVAARAPKETLKANEGQPVFRIPMHRGTIYLTPFFCGGFILAFLCGGFILARPSLGSLSAASMLAGAAAGVAGYRLGRRTRVDECSDASCEARIPVEEETCPKCGGRVIGEIKRREDRLDALEEHQRRARASRKKRAGSGKRANKV